MKVSNKLTQNDIQLVKRELEGFIPEEVYDIHAHPYDPAHFGPDAFLWLQEAGALGCKQHVETLQKYMPFKKMHGLYFGMPHRSANRAAINSWINGEVKQHGSSYSRALKLVSPADSPDELATDLRAGLFAGVKVYHIYASRPDTMNASLLEYAPEWMWEILHETHGVMMLHIVRNGAIADEDNQKEIKRLCSRYPNVKLILAHVARSFNYRNARAGLQFLQDIDNVVVDTSAIAETESFKAAIKYLGPKRILWGSDYAVSEMRGRCVSTGDYFFWLHPELILPTYKPATDNEMPLVGIESLLTLKEACEDSGLTKEDIQDIFFNNAIRLLGFQKEGAAASDLQGPALWKEAKSIISGGTGLLSKRADLYDPENWPAYFTKSAGAEVWDMNNRRYVDFAGGIGAVLLGYADEAVNAALQRRILSGTYSTLVNPQEIELAKLLLELHPWASKVRYARGGGEAMTVAVRIARAATGKSGIAFCGYHGWHDWYLAANLGESNALDGHLLPGLQPTGVPRELYGTSAPFMYNDYASFEKALLKLEGNTAAVVMEPMRSQEPQNEFLEKIKAKCKEIGAVFVLDEISSGLRYGFPGAHTRLGIEPDMAVYAKAMGNGIPFGAIIGEESLMTKGEESFISSSYWTDGLGTAAALAVLKKIMEENVFEKVWEKGKLLQQELKHLSAKYPLCHLIVAGMPSTPNLRFQLDDLSSKAQQFYVRRMMEQGFLVSSIYYLMHAHQPQQIKAMLLALELTLKELENHIQQQTLETVILSKQAQSGFARLA